MQDKRQQQPRRVAEIPRGWELAGGGGVGFHPQLNGSQEQAVVAPRQLHCCSDFN